MATDSKKTAAKKPAKTSKTKAAAPTSAAPALAEPTASLGSRFIVRVLSIVQSETAQKKNSPAALVQEILTQDGHVVTTTTPDKWRLSIHDPLPEVILLDIGCAGDEARGKPDHHALAALCRQIRETQEIRHVPIAVVSALKSGKDDDSTWADLRAAGTDDILNSRLSRAEVEARIALLAHYGRARRDLGIAREQLNRHTQFDEVTQLMNRRFFFQAAHRETSRARRYRHTLACLMIEVDYFDRITKNYGYGCGDYVLRSVSYIVRQWTRESDILGRFGDTKIAVLLPETLVEGAGVVRDKIQRAVMEGHFEWDNEKLPVSVSIGEAERRWNEPVEPDDDEVKPDNQPPAEEEETEALSVREELAELLADADAALNIAKKSALCPPVFVEYAPEPDSSGGT